VPMSGIPDMTPTSLAAAVALCTGKIIKNDLVGLQFIRVLVRRFAIRRTNKNTIFLFC